MSEANPKVIDCRAPDTTELVTTRNRLYAANALCAACEAIVRAWDAFEYDESGHPRFDSMNRFQHAVWGAKAALAEARGEST